jgi:hypothetical protein
VATVVILLINLFLSLIIIFYYIKLIIFIFLGVEMSTDQSVRNFTYNFFMKSSLTEVQSFFRSDLMYPFGPTTSNLPTFNGLAYIKLRNTDFYIVCFILSFTLIF